MSSTCRVSHSARALTSAEAGGRADGAYRRRVDVDGQALLAELSRTRRRRRLDRVDWFDSFYNAYLTALAVGIATIVGSTYVPDETVSASAAVAVAADGPAVLGVGIAVLLALGLRSGGRGGPLALEAPTVQHVLLAPVDRSAALRGAAIRQLRFGSFVGAVAGAVTGLLAARRLPVDLFVTVLTTALAGALVAVAVVGTALVASGRRITPTTANLVALAVVASAGADVVAGTAISPPALLGRLTLAGLEADPIAVGGVFLALAVGWLGLASVGGTSLEAARRRAGLVSELRFAVTLQDLRTVVLLRRRLAQERPRTRPWIRLPASGRGRLPTWRRGWAGIARFPAVRVVRMVVLGAIAGASLVGAWAGTSTLVVVAGVALYVAALDAVEPLAQEIDHPDRWAGFPLAPGGLLLRHLPASLVVMVVVCVIAGAAGTVVGTAAVALPLAAALVVPVAAASTTAAAASTSQGMAQPKSSFSAVPEAAGIALLFRNGWPIVLVVISLLPVLAARAAVDEGIAGAPVAAATAIIPVLLAAIALFWLSRRTPLRL